MENMTELVGEHFSIHSEVDPVRFQFYGCTNIARLQTAIQQRWGFTPAPNNMKYYMDQAYVFDRALYNMQCVGRENYNALLAEIVETLNKRALAMMQPTIEGMKIGYRGYIRDINQVRSFPDWPQMQSQCQNIHDVPLEFPYYSGLHYD